MADSPRCIVCRNRIPKKKLENARSRGIAVPIYCENPNCAATAQRRRQRARLGDPSAYDHRDHAEVSRNRREIEKAAGRCSLLCGRPGEIRDGKRLSRCKECREAQNAARRKT